MLFFYAFLKNWTIILLYDIIKKLIQYRRLYEKNAIFDSLFFLVVGI